jgi:hypothetical protein
MGAPSAACPSFDALDNPDIAIGRVPKCAECLPIAGTVMRGSGLRDAIKLEEDGALFKPVFIDARRQPSRQEAAPGRLKCRTGEPGICSKSLLVTYRAIHGNPICFSHSLNSLYVNVNRNVELQRARSNLMASIVSCRRSPNRHKFRLGVSPIHSIAPEPIPPTRTWPASSSSSRRSTSRGPRCQKWRDRTHASKRGRRRLEPHFRSVRQSRNR